MSYNTILNMAESESNKTLIINMSEDNLDRPYLISAILDIISDESSYISELSKDDLLRVVRLLQSYFDSCFNPYLDACMGEVKLERLMEYATSTVYYTYAPNGIRISTEKEVEAGVEELMPKVINNIEPEIAENLYLLLWTFTGLLRYYKKAGLHYTYENDRLKETKYQLIIRAGQKLKRLVDWISDNSNYERAIAVLKLIRKKGKYKYLTYAKDEISCEISPKKIIYMCKSGIVGGGASVNQKEALRVLYRIERQQYKPLPHDIALFRKVVTELQSGVKYSYSEVLPPDIYELCEGIETAANNGIINRSEFAFKIIDTVKRTLRCSPKQKLILVETMEKIDRLSASLGENKEESEQDSTDDKELLDIYNALGSGVLEV